MSNIEKISLIDKEKLNTEFYFQALLETAYSLQMLTDNDIEKIQYGCLELLANKSEGYNGGDSCSIRVEVAQSLMTSNLYTIGLGLKSYTSADDAVKALKEIPISELYVKGQKRIDVMLKSAKIFHSKVLENMIDNNNYFYTGTVVEGIKGFFKIYNPNFEAHEIHITADYQLCNPVVGLVGIEFISKYLESIHYENLFCQNFSADDIHHLLCGYDEDYEELLLNIYEHILAAAIGCIISGEDVHRLRMTESGISYLNKIFKDKSIDEIKGIVLNALNEFKKIFSLKGDLQEEYIRNSLIELVFKIKNAVDLQTLDKVFIISKYPQIKPKLYFSYGDKMEDKKYCKIVDEIIQCRYLSDKIAIIKKQIHSLADMEDILLDAQLSADEIITILHELNPPEIAALSKKYPLKSDIEAMELREQEQVLCKGLYEFIKSLPQEQQVWISKAVSMLEDDFD